MKLDSDFTIIGLNEGCFLGSDVKESKLGCEEKKNGNNLKKWLKRVYLKIANYRTELP